MSLGPEEKPDETMEPEHAKASNEHVQKPSDTKHEDETSISQQKTEQVSSSSPSNEAEKPPLNTPPPKPESDPNTLAPPEPATETKSPPVQTMGQPPGYDPNRIPASIFSTKTGNGADWSTTSNESLFSIHMGNNSFSRDYAILFGKSGELPKLDDWNGAQSNPYGELPRLDEWNSSPPSKSNEVGSLPPVMEAPAQEESSEFSGKFSKKDEDVSPKFVSGQTKEDGGSADQVKNVSPARKPPVPETNYSSLSNPTSSPSASRMSDSSGHSGSSFAFPVLAGNDSGKNDLIKVAPEKPEKIEAAEAQAQPQVSQETATVVSGTRWFTCFSWWPRFC